MCVYLSLLQKLTNSCKKKIKQANLSGTVLYKQVLYVLMYTCLHLCRLVYRSVLCMILNCTQWWCSNPGTLVSVEALLCCYYFQAHSNPDAKLHPIVMIQFWNPWESGGPSLEGGGPSLLPILPVPLWSWVVVLVRILSFN